MFRIKTLFGDRVRGFHGQAAELHIRCAVLNRMTKDA